MASPHFGPWPFGPSEIAGGTRDFEVGEPVHVELDGPKDAYVVRKVTACRQRQPDGTTCRDFDALNARMYPDMHLEESTPGELRFWLGDCCAHCSDSARLRFHEPSAVIGLREDMDLDSPLFRLASPLEREEHGLDASSGVAYCIVTNHGNGPDGPRIFIVARRVSIEHREARIG